MANKIGAKYYEVSAKADQGIDYLFRDLVKSLD
jgi:hypothetical protein